MRTEIIFEDKDILVVYKPAGIATQTSKVGERDVVSELKNHLKGGYVGVIHRLDQPVEGLLVFAKNQATAAALSRQVRAKASDGDEAGFCKDYLAVVLGKPEKACGRLENMMVKTADRTAEIIDGAEGKKAVLNYETLETISKEDYTLSLLRVRLETGRFHQIRAQLAHIGCPIIGDKKYGSEASIKCAEALRIRNVSLCADRLVLTSCNGKKAVGKSNTDKSNAVKSNAVKSNAVKDLSDSCEYTHKPMGSLFAEFAACK